MSIRKFIAVWLIVEALVVFSSCRQGFDELVEDPTKPTTVNPEFLFTEAMVRSQSDDVIGVRTELWTLAVWTQQIADIRGVATSSDYYNYGAAASDDVWDRWFVGSLSNIREMIRITEDDPGSVNKLAVARIWRAYLFHRMTDLWGDIPYSEALEANSDESNINPAYDAQSVIYADLLNELREAVASFDAELESLGAADPLYNGDLDSWTRFANSLRLRLAIRISNANPELAQEHGTEALATSLIESESQSARFPHDEQNGSSIYFLFNVLVDDNPVVHFYPSKLFIDLLDGKDDPRLSVYSSPTQESEIFGNEDYVGVPNLALMTELENQTGFNSSPIDDSFYRTPIEGNTMSYSEVRFLQAEAALIGWAGSGSAQDHYESGVRAHMEYLSIPDSAISSYLSAGGQFNNTLEQVITEKWVTFQYRDGFESFAEWRRTGFPQLIDKDGNAIDPASVPQRLPYPESEVLYNSEAVRSVGEGINDLESKVWWAR